MRLSVARVIYFKELLEAMRDWRTLMATIFIPIFIFPVLTFGFSLLAAKSLHKMQREGSTVMLLNATNAPELAASIRTNTTIKVVEPAADYVARINAKQLHAAVEFPPQFEAKLKSGSLTVSNVIIYSYAGEIRSGIAVRALETIVRDYRDRIVEQRLAERGLSKELIKPFSSTNQNVAEAVKVSGNILGGMIPYFIILLCFVGAVQPAIDVTAGEKERGTIETILATPVDRMELVFGKFLLVLTASLVTAFVSLISLGATFSLPFLALKELNRIAGRTISFDLSIVGLGSVFLLVIPLAIFFSAGLLALGLFAKSHKEAQTYVSPLVLIVLLPPVYAMIPGTEASLKLAAVPILNICLVSKELLSGNYPWAMLAITFGSSCLYAVLAMLAAVACFKRESVLFRA